MDAEKLQQSARDLGHQHEKFLATIKKIAEDEVVLGKIHGARGDLTADGVAILGARRHLLAVTELLGVVSGQLIEVLTLLADEPQKGIAGD